MYFQQILIQKHYFLEQYLAFQYSVLRETFFEGIFKLEPGCFLVYENGKLETQRYFTPDLIPQDMDENTETKFACFA